MKKFLVFLAFSLIVSACNSPVGRSWIIPVTIDPTDLEYSSSHMDQFETRRKRVLDSISEGYVILRSTDESSFNRHEFRTGNNFYYLTGFRLARSYTVLSKEAEHQFVLGLPPHNIRLMIYEGEHPGKDEIMDLYRPQAILGYHEFMAFMDSLLQTSTPLYLDRSDRTFYEQISKRNRESGHAEIRDISGILDEMRVIKESMEVERMQKACNITARALTNVMRECAPDMYEFEIEAVIEGTFLQYGSAMPGFPSIVGSGPNSTVLHYEPNTRLMEEGDLLLMDIGAEYGYYTADISRTIPVNGKFSEEQRAIYQLVLDAQLAAIGQMVPGNGFQAGHQAARKVISEGLAQLGLITDPEAKWQTDFYCIHGSSHYLGLDVHDVGNYSESRPLEPGMVLTIEPGVYVREKGLDQIHEMFRSELDSMEIAAFVDQVRPEFEKYIPIGVRIEDDILITQDGNINLSRYAPKEINDIEQLMR
ncbi:MAG: aminopeptidase P family protein [Bacteroidota bacterium]